MAKYYAVAKGKNGDGIIYRSWDECKKEVIGFKGAVYKSFPTLEEANNYIELHQKGMDAIQVQEEDSDILKVYVDGSFREESGRFSYGLAAILKGQVIYKDKGASMDKEALALRNVSGEVMGAMKAVDFAINNDHEEIELYFDYQGIESWALGTWKRNNTITEGYHRFMQEKMKKLKITFIKVKGHSGNKYNDLADKLAKEALE